MTVIVTIAVDPAAMVPREQIKGFARTQPPCVAEAAPSVVPAGTGSFSVTFVAAAGPWFVTTIRNTNELPTSPGFGEALFVMDKSTLAGFTTFKFTCVEWINDPD